MSVARFVADQRTNYRVPHTLACALLGAVGCPGSTSGWSRPPGWRRRRAAHDSDRRRASVDAAVRVAFTTARGLHGSPRLHADLRDAGWVVSEKTVADSMRRQGLVARKIKRRNGLTRQDKTAPKFPDLVKRDFTADAPNLKWVGDITEIPTADAGKLYLATVIDLYSRRLLGAATCAAPDAELACAAIKMAVAVRGGTRPRSAGGDLPHRPRLDLHRGSLHPLCRKLGIRQSMGTGRVVFRQRRRGGVLLQPGMGGPVPPRASRPLDMPRPSCCDWCYGFYGLLATPRMREV